MKQNSLFPFLVVALLPLTHLLAETMGTPFSGDPPDERHPWAVNDRHRPLPPVVKPAIPSTPEKSGRAPSDAIILFDGKNLDAWESVKPETHGKPAPWTIQGDVLASVPNSGNIATRQKFGDCQLHVEWAAPGVNKKPLGRLRGNSGIILMGILEINILDSYENPTFADGMAGSYLGINPPLANALHPSGEFQSVDIIFRRPIYKNNIAIDPGYLTIFMNGVLIQDHTPLEGITGPRVRAKACPYPEKESLLLQDHYDLIRFRNLWIRELPARAVEGGPVGILSTEATLAQRKETAKQVLLEAAQAQAESSPVSEMLLLWESLVYEKNEAISQKASALSAKYLDSLQKMTATQRAEKKGEILKVSEAFNYLSKFNLIPSSFKPKIALDKIITSENLTPPKKP